MLSAKGYLYVLDGLVMLASVIAFLIFYLGRLRLQARRAAQKRLPESPVFLGYLSSCKK